MNGTIPRRPIRAQNPWHTRLESISWITFDCVHEGAGFEVGKLVEARHPVTNQNYNYATSKMREDLRMLNLKMYDVWLLHRQEVQFNCNVLEHI